MRASRPACWPSAAILAASRRVALRRRRRRRGRDHGAGGDDGAGRDAGHDRPPATDERRAGDAWPRRDADGAGRAYPAQPAGVPFPAADWPTAPLPAGVDQAAIDAAVDAAFGAADAGGRRALGRRRAGRVRSCTSATTRSTGPTSGDGLVLGRQELHVGARRPARRRRRADARRAPAAAGVAAPATRARRSRCASCWRCRAGCSGRRSPASSALVIQMARLAERRRPDGRAAAGDRAGLDVRVLDRARSALIAGIAADALGGCAALDDYLHERLLDPLGITTEQLITDGGGCFVGGARHGHDDARLRPLRPAVPARRAVGRPAAPAGRAGSTRAACRRRRTRSTGCTGGWTPDGAASRPRACSASASSSCPTLDLVIAINSTHGGDPFTLTDAIRAAFALTPRSGPAPVCSPRLTRVVSR